LERDEYQNCCAKISHCNRLSLLEGKNVAYNPGGDCQGEIVVEQATNTCLVGEVQVAIELYPKEEKVAESQKLNNGGAYVVYSSAN